MQFDRISYRLSQADLDRYTQVAMRMTERSKGFWWRSIGMIILLILVAVIVLVIAGASGGGITALAGFFLNFWGMLSFVLALICAYLVWTLLRMRALLKPQPDGHVLGQRTLELEEEGVIITQDGVQQAWMWSAIDALAEDDDAFYLAVDNASAHIVPKHAFADETSLRTFAALAREKINASK